MLQISLSRPPLKGSKWESGTVKLVPNMRQCDGRAVADDKREAGGGCCAVRDNEFKHKPKVKQET